MPAGRPVHSAQRAIQDLTLGVARSRQKVAQRQAEMGLRELVLNYQFPIVGTAQAAWAFRQRTVNFDYTFYYAPGNRDSDLETPQFWFGYECDSDVLVTARVKSWLINDHDGGTIGAVVGVGFSGVADTDFTGVLHTSFQGFGVLNDGDSPDQEVS